MVEQVTVFLENEEGRLALAVEAISAAGINMHALFLADSERFGVLRLFCDEPHRAVEVLREAGFRASVAELVAVRLADEPGTLARLLMFLHGRRISVAYAHCFLDANGYAVDVLKVDDPDTESILREAGFSIVEPEELYAV